MKMLKQSHDTEIFKRDSLGFLISTLFQNTLQKLN